MRSLDISRRAGVAGAVLFALPVLDVILGAGAPDTAHGVVGTFGLALLAISGAAIAARRWQERCSHSRSDWR